MSEDSPKTPSIPVKELLDASHGLPREFQSAIVLLCMKIDKGFGSMLSFMGSVRSRIDTNTRSLDTAKSTISDLKDQVATLVRQQSEASSRIAELEGTVTIKLAEGHQVVTVLREREATSSHKLAKLEAEKETEHRIKSEIELKQVAEEEKAEKAEDKRLLRRDRLIKVAWGGVGASVIYGFQLLAKWLGLVGG